MLPVLLLNLGGPERPEEVGPFLRNLFNDPMIIDLPCGALLRRPLAGLITMVRTPKVKRLYRKIGGGSPLLSLTERQAEALRLELEERGAAEPIVGVVMRYTKPDADEMVRWLRQSGHRRVIALPLYPQECRATTGSSLAALEDARRRIAPDLEIIPIRGYPTHPGYIDAVAEKIEEALQRLREEDRSEAVVLYSAHGVPTKLTECADPYVEQICETVAAVQERMGREREYRLAFQSRSGPVRWVGPSTEATIRELRDRRAVVVVPISFVSDHIETLYEIDILFAALAKKVGIRHFVRAESLNHSTKFIRALGDLVASATSRTEVADG